MKSFTQKRWNVGLTAFASPKQSPASLIELIVFKKVILATIKPWVSVLASCE